MLLVLFLCASTPIQAATEGPSWDRTQAVKIIAGLRKIVTPDGVERLQSLDVNGVEQWVSIRSRNPTNPVLLVVHGGPGWVAMPTSWYFAQGWDEYFTVVQWDQRGAGKSYDINALDTLSIEQMRRDLDAVVGWIRSETRQDRIFLLGHSWGSLLGLDMARRHPEWLYAYVGAGQVVDMRESERRGWAWAMQKARERGNSDAVAELQSIAPYAEGSAAVSITDLYVQRKWVNFFGGAAYNRPDAGFEAAAMALSPEYTDDNLRDVWKAQATSVERLMPEIMDISVSSLTDLRVPVILLLGRHDVNVSAQVAAEWFDRIQAPAKKLVWFEHSAHEMLVEEPGKVFLTLVNEVRPLAIGVDEKTPAARCPSVEQAGD
ncbi:alpha/beta fold hydrolase [Stenotrophomonas maltophilia]|uniref:alpha/beta fold hydrolase n=1 Tax=Stenotrophomonas maltophilia TaxID=40324 RepID=UPI002894D2EF|nr:alpha/beta hydrolase [Stenotrophomonas maltophilia]MDT3501979.1 alpha/beta hydrolase [Stenotrophomonas maltophilia]